MSNPPSSASVARRALIVILLALATIALVGAQASIWANNLFLQPTSWERTSEKLLDDPTVRASAASYLVNVVDAQLGQLIAGQPLSGVPGAAQLLTPALRPAAVVAVEQALSTSQAADLWRAANLAAATAYLNVVNSPSPPGTITIDLDPVLDRVADQLHLPRSLISQLPPGTARLTVLAPDGVRTARTAGRVTRLLARWLIVAALVLVVLALLLSRGRLLKTLMLIGLAAAVAGGVILIARAVLTDPIVNAVTADQSLRDTIRASVGISTRPLTSPAIGLIVGGLALSALAGGAQLEARRRRVNWGR